MPQQINIPVQLAQLAFQEGIVTQFKVLIASKMVTPGYFTINGTVFNNLCLFVGLKPKTVKKHLRFLVDKGWLGADYSKRKYYVRSWEWFFMNKYFTRTRSVRFKSDDIRHFKAFLAGSVISDHILKHKNHCRHEALKLTRREKLIEKTRQNMKPVKSVVLNGSTTSQDHPVSVSAKNNHPDYFGFSNLKISSLLNRSETRARELKHEAEQQDYIKTNPKRLVLQNLTTYDPYIRSIYYKMGGEEYGKKLRFISEFNNEVKTIVFYQQLHDEIIPSLSFVSLNYRKRIIRRHNQNRKSTSTRQQLQSHTCPLPGNGIMPVLFDGL